MKEKISRTQLGEDGWVTTGLLPLDREALERKGRHIVWSSITSQIVGTEEATEEAALESAKDADEAEESAKEAAEAAEGESEAAK